MGRVKPPLISAKVASGDEGFISIACSLGSLPNKIDGSSHVSGKPSREAVGKSTAIVAPTLFLLCLLGWFSNVEKVMVFFCEKCGVVQELLFFTTLKT